ncbi:hypothetical protein PghCCS26_61880 [Paenibacillus glycanilyticus]|uniref:Spore germination protein n=1 Tax=Paenibacillus glycanilyticus TaxID=126569 RepID=A0ABQ6NWT8_9BACL|nr:spore germination protein [Paenibacillus glycanilyticus]GMK49058.1 hypothetical protein PghCCS26_61880 [Paenibacillus glycanilyticus]
MNTKSSNTTIVEQISIKLGQSPDFVCQRLDIDQEWSLYCIYLASIVTTNQIDEMILKPAFKSKPNKEYSIHHPIPWLIQQIPLVQRKEIVETSEGINELLEGHCLLIPSTGEAFLSYDVANGEFRSVGEPSTESSVRGSREGFVEDVSRNVALIRKRLKNENLVFEEMTIGTATKTKVCLTFLDQVASDEIIDEFRSRLKKIQADSVLESAYIEEWIQDQTMSPFPQLLSSERPDIVVAKLLEGQVAVMVDGTPNVLMGPITFFQLFSSSEDYYQRAAFLLWRNTRFEKQKDSLV